MNDWWEVGQWKEAKSGKKWFLKLGSAKQDDRNGGFVIFMDALPLQDAAGRCVLNIQPPRERGAGGNFDGPTQTERGPRRDPPGTGQDFNDEIPF